MGSTIEQALIETKRFILEGNEDLKNGGEGIPEPTPVKNLHLIDRDVLIMLVPLYSDDIS